MIYSKIKNIVYHIINEFFDLIYKRKCVHCNCSISEGILCKTCSKTVQNLPAFAQGIINGYKVYSVFYYEGAIKSLIHSLKFKHQVACASYAAEYLSSFLDKIKEEINLENAVIIPVPTHKKNQNKRGYDNVFEISKKLIELKGLKLDSTSLKKVKFTTPQYKLSAKQRRNNVKGSFSLDENFKTDSLIIILDDIVTTGSTLESITDLFKERGFCNLICLTLSKAKNF